MNNELDELIQDNGILISEQVSPNISTTPEGYLLCTNATLARTGEQVYSFNEIPLAEPKDGKIIAIRTAEEVFTPEAIASFEGKPITLEHPREMVNPSNWSDVAIGITTNVRQEGQLLKGDLLITDVDAIKQIQERGMRKLSCGYNSKLEQDEPGIVRQTLIRGNHLAIVTNPRAGDICSIKDSTQKEPNMNKQKSIKNKLLQFVGLVDSEAEKLAEELADEETTEAHEQQETAQEETIEEILKGLITRIDALEAMNAKDSEPEEEKEEVTDEETKETKETDCNDEDEDGEYPLGDAFNTFIQRAEILAPGSHFITPITDGTNAKTARSQITDYQRAILKDFSKTTSGSAILDSLNTVDINRLSADALGVLFNSAAVIKGKENNTRLPSMFRDSNTSKNIITEMNNHFKTKNS